MVNEQFQWQRHPDAEALIKEALEEWCRINPYIARLRDDLDDKTSTRLFDWLDHIVLREDVQIKEKIEKLGFAKEASSDQEALYRHPGAQLPSIILSKGEFEGAAASVESIEDFLMVRGYGSKIEGTPFSGYRRSMVNREGDCCFWAVERRGERVLEPEIESEGYLKRYFSAKAKWKCRNRSGDPADAIIEAKQIAAEMAEEVGQNRAAWIVLECEREYWQARNSAAQIQKGRQDRLGMGWANHDHHTFRSSRRYFKDLVEIFEILGFFCRERFYAGEEAGWGAQVMENSACSLVLFLDVDLDPHELAIDFSKQALGELERLGTIGLWCSLHGDSINSSGMHHLEAQFNFEQLTADLAERGVRMMQPFSHFPYLKQAFTQGEIWDVALENIEQLLKSRKITKVEAERFHTEGALGSHLENLQREEGYKGFNQKNVSFIIKKTDPRYIEKG